MEVGRGPSSSEVCPLVALPGTPCSLCSLSHTQGAGHRLGWGCWHGAGRPGSSDLSFLGVGGGGLTVRKPCWRSFGWGYRGRERGDMVTEQRALGCPFCLGCKTPRCEGSFSQPGEGISLTSSVLRGSTQIFLLQKNAGPKDQPHSESALMCLLLPLLPPPRPLPPPPPPAPMRGPASPVGLQVFQSGFQVIQ